MQLLTGELRASIPRLYSQEHVRLDERIVHAKFFFPAGNWTWFVTEGEEEDRDYRMFGFVIGFEEEWGYFSLNELESISAHGWTVERDIHFEPGKFADVIESFRKERGL
ncbi:MAG: DUF2958 domain-containing protein [Acidobacteria bacterium]|nr:DUF2958 domain-containing protein [Acidobacteriota bacterium]